MISVGRMAKMYGLLPSQVKHFGTTYDIKVTEALMAWENKLYEESASGVPAAPNLSQEQMKAMIEKVREKKSG